MLFLSRHKFKADQSPESVNGLLAIFGERGAAPGEIAHYVATDVRGGAIITEADSLEEVYENSLHFQQWLALETTPVLTMEQALRWVSGS